MNALSQIGILVITTLGGPVSVGGAVTLPVASGAR
jgi:hypothetical protein